MTPESRQVGWGLELWWVSVSIVGMAIGEAVDGSVGLAVYLALSPPGPFNNVGHIVASVVGGMVSGGVIGVIQWLVLRQYIYQLSLWWVLASMAGWAIARGGYDLHFVVVSSVSKTMDYIIAGTMFGGVVGAMQWLVLQRYVSRAGWWILATIGGIIVRHAVYEFKTIAEMVSSVAIKAADLGIGLRGTDALYGAVNGTFTGVITGIALIWLLPQPAPAIIKERPKSVTVISWLLIVLAISAIYLSTAVLDKLITNNLDKRLFIGPFLAIGVAGAIQVVIGVGMLKGHNWARLLFLWLAPVSVILALISGTLGSGTIVMMCWYIICAVYLTRPKISEHFTGSHA